MTWSVAHGTPNPLTKTLVGYLSDPDIVYASSRNTLYMYYREVSDSDYIHVIESTNGTSWNAGVRIFAAPLTSALSPAVVRRSHDEWLMWTVNADSGCHGPRAKVELRRSADGMVWSDPEPVDMDLHGYSAWHIDVQWIPTRDEYWALVPVKTGGSCATRQLFIATSPDGITWTTAPNAVARAGASEQFRDIVYRSTFAYDPSADAINFWLSGARMVGDKFIWSTAAMRRSRSDVFFHTESVGDAAPCRAAEGSRRELRSAVLTGHLTRAPGSAPGTEARQTFSIPVFRSA